MTGKSGIEIDDGFNHIDPLPLCKELAGSGADGQGGFKTGDDSALPYHSGKRSSFSVSVERMLAVDGWEDETKVQRMTLLVLSCEVISTEKSCNVSFVNTWFDLEDEVATEAHNRASPKIQAWGPFVEPTAWNRSVQSITTGKKMGGELGGSAFGADAKLDAEWTQTLEGKKRYFDKGHTEKHYSRIDNRLNGIAWIVAENEARKEGVPCFSVAILFERMSDVPLDINFGFKCDAGLWENMKSRFGLGKDAKRKFQYVPHPGQPRATRQAGKDLLAMVDPNKLGALCKRDNDGHPKLMKLTHIANLQFIKP